MTYTVDDNVPFLKEYRMKGSQKYPFATMQKGQSFSYPAAERQRVWAAASYAGKRLNKKFITRPCPKAQGTHYRCWRIE